MVGAWREARRRPLLIARGILELLDVREPTRRQIGTAAVLGEFLSGAAQFLYPKRRL